MKSIFFITSPLEQFVVNPIFVPYIFDFAGLSFTNQSIVLILIFFFSNILIDCFLVSEKTKKTSFVLIPSNFQLVLEQLNLLILSLAIDNIKDKSAKYYIPLLYFIFIFLLSLNLFGLIPYSFTLTSHLVITLCFALILFFGINILGVKKHGLHFFSLFLPPGTSVLLAFLLIPIELISFIFKPVSLSIRLFANMMAGHTLLKVIAGFAYTLMGLGGLLFFLHLFPLIILIPLFALEFGVALIQTFVFTILVCIYINDAMNLH
jgi:ATP synthase subunit 6